MSPAILLVAVPRVEKFRANFDRALGRVHPDLGIGSSDRDPDQTNCGGDLKMFMWSFGTNTNLSARERFLGPAAMDPKLNRVDAGRVVGQFRGHSKFPPTPIVI